MGRAASESRTRRRNSGGGVGCGTVPRQSCCYPAQRTHFGRTFVAFGEVGLERGPVGRVEAAERVRAGVVLQIAMPRVHDVVHSTDTPASRRSRHRTLRAPDAVGWTQTDYSRLRYNDAALKARAAEILTAAHQSDCALLERIAGRDAGAVGELYDRHSRLLYGLILRIVRDRSEAEEILQEVFVLVWNRVTTYNPGLGPPAAWLVGIARNRAIDRLRANSARRRAIESARIDVESNENPETDALVGEQQRAIRQALETHSARAA